jgi:transposase-like protein
VKDESALEATSSEVLARPKRRSYTAAYKRQVVEEADRLVPEERAAYLRKEGLYSSHLTQWRRELGQRGGIEDKKRGPKANPDRERLRKLERENAQLQKKLKQAELIIGAQKKLAEILGTVLPTEEEVLGHPRDK